MEFSYLFWSCYLRLWNLAVALDRQMASQMICLLGKQHICSYLPLCLTGIQIRAVRYILHHANWISLSVTHSDCQYTEILTDCPLWQCSSADLLKCVSCPVGSISYWKVLHWRWLCLILLLYLTCHVLVLFFLVLGVMLECNIMLYYFQKFCCNQKTMAANFQESFFSDLDLLWWQ